MIISDRTRTVPEIWTDTLCRELFNHARELGQNGNPGGYILTVELFPYVGFTEGENRYLKKPSDWDYDGIRTWIDNNMDQVTLAWQRIVVPPY